MKIGQAIKQLNKKIFGEIEDYEPVDIDFEPYECDFGNGKMVYKWELDVDGDVVCENGDYFAIIKIDELKPSYYQIEYGDVVIHECWAVIDRDIHQLCEDISLMMYKHYLEQIPKATPKAHRLITDDYQITKEQ